MRRGFVTAPPFLLPMGAQLPGAPPMMPPPPTNMPAMPPLPVQSQATATNPHTEAAPQSAGTGVQPAVPVVSMVPNLPFPLPTPAPWGVQGNSVPLSHPGVLPPQNTSGPASATPPSAAGTPQQTASQAGTGGGQGEAAAPVNTPAAWPAAGVGGTFPLGGMFPVAGPPMRTASQPVLAQPVLAQHPLAQQQAFAQQVLAQQALLQQQALAGVLPGAFSAAQNAVAEQGGSSGSSESRVQALPKSGTYSTRGRGVDYSTRG